MTQDHWGQQPPQQPYRQPQPPPPRWRFGHGIIVGAGGMLVLSLIIATAAAGGSTDTTTPTAAAEDTSTTVTAKATASAPAKHTPTKPKPAPTTTKPKPRPPARPTISEGTWDVGSEVKPGTYVGTVPDDSSNCYWARLRNFDGGMNSIIANDNASPGERVRIAVRSSDAGIELSGCGTLTKVG